jgi:NADPH-dependent 2,4-dienoyl-CoA reductase/sulfur reductase-like enzyme
MTSPLILQPQWGAASAPRARVARTTTPRASVVRNAASSDAETKKTTTKAATVTHTKPRVAVIGAGWGGFGAAKALCEAGCEVTLLDGIPDPTGACVRVCVCV